MTNPNIYGIYADVSYDFDGWTWENRDHPGLVERISREAAETVLKEMAKDSHIWLDSNDAEDTIIEFSCFDGHVRFEIPLSEIIDKWLISRAGGPNNDIHPDDAQPLLTVLEAAVARIRAALR